MRDRYDDRRDYDRRDYDRRDYDRRDYDRRDYDRRERDYDRRDYDRYDRRDYDRRRDDYDRRREPPRSMGGPPTAMGGGGRGGGGGGGGGYGNPRVFVGNLNYQTKWPLLKDYFKQCGIVRKAEVMTDAEGRATGNGIVEFESARDAERAIRELNDTQLDGRRILVREDREPPRGGGGGRDDRGRDRDRAPPAANRSRSPRTFTYHGQSITVATRVKVLGLPEDIKWTDLKDFFKSVGPVRYANAEWQGGEWVGVVEFETTDDAMRAIIEKNDTMMDDRRITIREDEKDRDLHGTQWREERSRERGRDRDRDFRDRDRDFRDRDRDFRDRDFRDNRDRDIRRRSRSRSRSPRRNRGPPPVGNNTYKPGDWECPECKFHNYARRTTCHNTECGAPRPADSERHHQRTGSRSRSSSSSRDFRRRKQAEQQEEQEMKVDSDKGAVSTDI